MHTQIPVTVKNSVAGITSLMFLDMCIFSLRCRLVKFLEEAEPLNVQDVEK